MIFLYAKGKAPDCGKGLTNVSCYFSQKDSLQRVPAHQSESLCNCDQTLWERGTLAGGQVGRSLASFDLLWSWLTSLGEVAYTPSPARGGVESLEFLLGNVFRACGTFFWRSSNIPPLRVDWIFVNSQKLLGIKGRHYIKVSSKVVQFL